MDLLYSRYASPVEFMDAYIGQGRFGEFVANVFEMERKRKQDAAGKEDDDRLWQAYIHSMTDITFQDWKEDLLEVKEPVLYSMTDSQVRNAKRRARDILSRVSPA